jgi:hypothetical protein
MNNPIAPNAPNDTARSRVERRRIAKPSAPNPSAVVERSDRILVDDLEVALTGLARLRERVHRGIDVVHVFTEAEQVPELVGEHVLQIVSRHAFVARVVIEKREAVFAVFAVEHDVGVEDLLGVRIERDDGDGERAVGERVTVRSKAHRVLVATVAAVADRIFWAVLHHDRRQDAGGVLPGGSCPHDGLECFPLATEQTHRILHVHRDGALLPTRATRACRTQSALLCRSRVCSQSDDQCRCARERPLQFPLTDLC